MDPITESILLTVKKMLGIAEEYHAFDIDIITDINSVFLTLQQLMVGPDRPFQIHGEEETWYDFLGDAAKELAATKTYVYMKTRLLFDPPTNSFLVDAMQNQINELEWRLNVQAERRSHLGSNEVGVGSREQQREFQKKVAAIPSKPTKFYR